MAMSFSIPMMVNKGHHELRITAILIAALVILISLLVGTVAFPKLLPSKANSYTPEEFADTLSKTVAYAIRRLNGEGATADKEKSLVMDQLASQANMSLHINSKSYQQISVANVEKLLDEGQISPESEEHYLRLIIHLNIMQGHNHPFRNIMMAFRGMKWRWIHRRQIRKTMYKLPKWTKEVKLIADSNLKEVSQFLNSIQNGSNAAEVAAVRHAYMSRHRVLTRQDNVDDEKMNQIFIYAFQLEHSYIQQEAAEGNISQDLANALNEQVSTSQLVYLQSLD